MENSTVKSDIRHRELETVLFSFLYKSQVTFRFLSTRTACTISLWADSENKGLKEVEP